MQNNIPRDASEIKLFSSPIINFYTKYTNKLIKTKSNYVSNFSTKVYSYKETAKNSLT